MDKFCLYFSINYARICKVIPNDKILTSNTFRQKGKE